MPDTTQTTPGSSDDNPLTIHCSDALGRQRTTTVFVRDGLLVVAQPEPGAAVYDWHGAAELVSAIEVARRLLPSRRVVR